MLDLFSPVVAGFLVLGVLSIAVAFLAHLVTRQFIAACVAAMVVVSLLFDFFVRARWPGVFIYAWATGALVALPLAMLVGLAVRALRAASLPRRAEPSPEDAAAAKRWRTLRKIAATHAGYHALYIYRVPLVKVDAFLQNQRAMADIYTRLGAVSSDTFQVAEGSGKYGCSGIFDVVKTEVDELVFVGIDSFENRAHYRSLMTRLNADPELTALYEKRRAVLELQRVVRAEIEGANRD